MTADGTSCLAYAFYLSLHHLFLSASDREGRDCYHVNALLNDLSAFGQQGHAQLSCGDGRVRFNDISSGSNYAETRMDSPSWMDPGRTARFETSHRKGWLSFKADSIGHGSLEI
jgi:hypothetical protein